MIPFTFQNQTTLIFGPESVEQAGIVTSSLGRRAMVVTGLSSARRTGVLDRLNTILTHAGVVVDVFSGVESNPKITSVRKALDRLKHNPADVIIALGGGSVMDCAKVIAAAWYYEDDPWNMLYHGQPSYRPPIKALPVVAIPTLAATASEMNGGAVISNPDTGEKCLVKAQCLFPATAIADPTLTLTVPLSHTVYGAVDIMAHVLESYFNGADDTPLQDRMQESVVLTVMHQLPRLLERPDDISARANLQWASIVGFNGWVHAGSNGPMPLHLIEHVISGRYDISHGAGLAVLLLGWMKMAPPFRLHKYVQLARRVFGLKGPKTAGEDGEWDVAGADSGTKAAAETRAGAGAAGAEVALQNGNQERGSEQQEIGLAMAHAATEQMEAYLRAVNAPVRLGELGVNPDDLEWIADAVLRLNAGTDGKLAGTPALDRLGILQLLALCSNT